MALETIRSVSELARLREEVERLNSLVRSRILAAEGSALASKAQLTACQQQLVAAREALAGMLPLALKLFNNTVTAVHERGTPLEPAGVTFEDLKFVQLSRAALSYIADSSQAEKESA